MIQQKKVLIVSSHFAPDIHVGAKRPTKFTKFLPELGWKPIVLTTETKEYHAIDKTLNNNLPDNIDIYRVKRWHPIRKIRVWKFFSKVTGGRFSHNGNLAGIKNQPPESKAIRLVDYIFFYDYGWLIPAFFKAMQIVRKHRIRIVFTSGPIYDANILGFLLKIFARKKWVSEFRDPWIFSATYHPYAKMPFFRRVIDRNILKLLLKSADRTVVVGIKMKQSFCQLLPYGYQSKFHVIYNGYDVDDFPKPILKRWIMKSKFSIAHLGTWGQHVSPIFFLKALGNLLREHEELRNHIHVKFIGEVKYDPELALQIRRNLKRENLEGIVHEIPFLPHREGIKEVLDGDVLLLIIGLVPEKRDCVRLRVTAKLFEYLYIKKPILALVPPDGEAAKIIREANAGEIVSPTDIEGIENKIYEMYRSFKSGKLKVELDNPFIEKFNRREQVKELAGIFDSLIRK